MAAPRPKKQNKNRNVINNSSQVILFSSRLFGAEAPFDYYLISFGSNSPEPSTIRCMSPLKPSSFIISSAPANVSADINKRQSLPPNRCDADPIKA
jgi:hypothetical protein